MEFKLALLSLAVLAVAQHVPRDSQPVPIPLPTGDPIPAPPPPSASAPAPSPSSPPAQPPPVPTPTGAGTPPPSGTAVPPGAICECGYTYCANILLNMAKPWTEDQLKKAYCSTDGATCKDGTPATNVTNALYICLCEGIDQKVGDHLDLLCGCSGKCLVDPPDFRGRCAKPCVGSCGKGGGGDSAGEAEDGNGQEAEINPGWPQSWFS